MLEHPHESVPKEVLPSVEVEGVGFDLYREACDSASLLSRKQGIFLEKPYQEALADHRSVVIEAANGLQVPVSTPTELVPGLNQEFFAKKFPSGATYVNPLLVDRADYPSVARLVAETAVANKTALFYEFSMEKDYGTREFISLVAENMRDMGIAVEYDEIEDPAVDDEHAAYKPAAMIMFEGNIMHTGAREIHSEGATPTDDSIADYFWQGVEAGEIPADEEEGSVIYSGKQITEEEGLIDELWDIYKDRFSELGADYPISLEDSFEEFVEMLTSPDTMTVIGFADSEVSCFTFFAKDLKTAFWLNDKSLLKLYGNEAPFYFPGIVAHRDRSSRAKEVLFAIGRTVKYAQLDFKILYECTNHSATYVPDIIEAAAKESGLVTINNKQQETIAYRVLKPKF